MSYSFYTARETKPQGWLRRQLEIQAHGLSGHLHEIWPDIRDSAWIGGNRDSWERVPYWLDGFVPLAYALEDEKLIAVANRYVNAILERQEEDGWICPCKPEDRPSYDMWAYSLILKVLTVYADCTGDDRIEDVLGKAIACFSRHIDRYPLFNWAKFRWYEALVAVRWLQKRRPSPELLAFADKMHAQGFDYAACVLSPDWPEKKPVPKWTMESHGVNAAMMLKSEDLYREIKGEPADKVGERMYRTVMRYHGTCAGHFNADECFAGKSPIQGSELCLIAEEMYSFETLFELSEDPRWLDRLERLAFNSLPATLSADMWTHQYDQTINQSACVRQGTARVFLTNIGESGLFGLEPGYGCCTANFNQAFPKFALSAFCHKKSGEREEILSSVSVPSELNTRVDGVPVRISLQTQYPFRDELVYTVSAEKKVSFDFSVRIPLFAESATVEANGKTRTVLPGRKVTLGRTFKGTTTIRIVLQEKAQMRLSPDGMYHVERGALLFSVPVKASRVMHEFVRDGVERKYPYCDYELFPVSYWNYAFTGLEEEIPPDRIRFNEVGEYPFSPDTPPVQIEMTLARVSWGTAPGSSFQCAAKPSDLRQIEKDTHTILLQPYGCTDLRMTDLPIVRGIHPDAR